MLLIKNALYRAGELNIKDIDHDRTVPKLKIQLESQAGKIWNSYFQLLYDTFELPMRIKERKEYFEAYVPKLASKLFQNGEVDREYLLKLLVQKPKKHANEILLIKRKDPLADKKREVYKAFCYDDLTKSHREAFSELIRLLDVNVCPYCGRAFTTTAKKDRKDYIRANQVDHFYPKSLYPYLALSIWNWIPSCGPCNNRKKDDGNDLFLYPYEQDLGDDYRFVTHLKSGIGYLLGKENCGEEFEINLDASEACIADRSTEKEEFRRHADYEIAKLGIETLYASHKGYVCDIFRQRYVFGDAYIDSLVASFPDLFQSRADVRNLLYMKQIDSDSIGKAPLDKLTRDIDFEIDALLQ